MFTIRSKFQVIRWFFIILYIFWNFVNKKKGSQAEKEARVSEIISELRLESSYNTLVGGDLLKGISGGERKRTSIGVELITNPPLIMLDGIFFSINKKV